MHVIIAGTARAGKTTVSMTLNERGFVHYKMDSIKRGMCEAYNLKYDDWDLVSPIMCKIINRIIIDNKTDTNYKYEKYLFDTPFIYPKDLELIDTTDTLVIFMGYPDLTYEEAFLGIRKYDKDTYWTSKIDDNELMQWCHDNVEFFKSEVGRCVYMTSNEEAKIIDEIDFFVDLIVTMYEFERKVSNNG